MLRLRSGAVREPVAISAIPFGYLRRDAIGDRVYPVGDQPAVIASYTGDGTSLALCARSASERSTPRRV